MRSLTTRLVGWFPVVLALAIPAAAEAGKTYYWISHGSPADPVWTYFLAGAKQWATDTGNTVNTSFHNGQVAPQQEAVRAAIAAKADGNDHAAGCSATPGRPHATPPPDERGPAPRPSRKQPATFLRGQRQQPDNEHRQPGVFKPHPRAARDQRYHQRTPANRGGDMTGPAETTRRPPRNRTACGAGVGPRRTASPTGFACPPRMTGRQSR